MKKKLIALTMIMVMVLSLAALTGCGEKDDNVLVVGLDDTFVPMGFRDEAGDLVGFDIDLAKEVAKELDMEVEFKPINWKAKEAELEAGTVDCLWNGMSVTPERIEAMALTNQYFNNKIVIMALADSGVDVTAPEELAKLNIGTQAGSAALEMLKDNEAYDSYKDNITEYDTYDIAIMDLKAGRLDVVVVDQVYGEYSNNQLDGIMKECTYSFGDDFYTIGCAADNTELRDKLNEALKTLIDNGTAAEISKEWFGRDLMAFQPVEGEE